MNEIIEKLKKNWMGWGGCDPDEWHCLRAADKTHNVVMALQTADGIMWPDKPKGPFLNHRIYRIHKDYQPEPDTPVFPGYVLCEAFEATNGKWWFKKLDRRKEGIEYAIGCGCVGYVFKEWLGRRFNTPIMFVTPNGRAESVCTGDCKPATIGWVVFKETE